MAVEKVSLSIDAEVLAQARERAGQRELSAYVSDALSRQLQHDRLIALLDEMDAEVGPVPDELLEEARRLWQPAAKVSPQRLILDAGAVIALARRDVRARSVLRAAATSGVQVAIPSVVVAETVRGDAADARVNLVVKAVDDILAADEAVCRQAGRLLARARSDATIDAIVVATAISAGGAVVLTSDPDDLRALASGHRVVVVEPL